MEEMRTALVNLTGAINAQIELTKKLDQRILALERPLNTVISESVALPTPKN